MLTGSAQLADEELAAVARLEERVLAVDGGRLKLEWGVLRQRDGSRVCDLLWREGDQVTGFCGLYGFGAELELAGMVDPAGRRRGIGTALLRAAAALGLERGAGRALLVTPRGTEAGHAFARRHGGVLHHTEHHLSLDTAPAAPPRHHGIEVRDATPQDRAEMKRILGAAFGDEPDESHLRPTAGERQVVVVREGAVVGCLRLTDDGGSVGVYGFAVDPALQGRGIGRAVLSRVCGDLLDHGARRVTLEVAVDNDRALGLYTSVGFRRETTEDYYEVVTAALVAPAARPPAAASPT